MASTAASPRPDAGRNARRRPAGGSELPARPRSRASMGSYYPSTRADVTPAGLTIPPAAVSAGDRSRHFFGVHARCTERAPRVAVGGTLAVDLLDAPAMPGPPSLRSLAARNAML